MSLTKLSLAGNILIIPGQGEFGKWYPGWGRKTFFYSEQLELNYISLGKIIHTWSSPHGTVVWKLFILIIFPNQVFFPNNSQLTKFLSLLHMYCTIFIVHTVYPTSVSWLLTSPFFYCNCSPLRHHVPFYVTVYAQNKLRLQVWDGKTSAVLGSDRKFLQKGGSTSDLFLCAE